jgi:hypothetical protein
MHATIDKPAAAERIFDDIRRKMAEGGVVQISYDTVPNISFSKQKEVELTEILSDIEHGKNISPTFTNVDDLFSHLETNSDNA